MKNFKYLTYIFMASIMIVSCTKEDQLNINKTNSSISKSAKEIELNDKTEQVIGSALNPYNNLGVEHNRILDYLRGIYYPGISKSIITESAISLLETDSKYSGLHQEMDSIGFIDSIVNYQNVTNFHEEITEWLDDEKITTSEYNYLESLLSACEVAQCANCTYDEAVNMALQSIFDIENNILSDQTLNSSERQLLLCGVAFVKYSMTFWKNEVHRSSTSYAIPILIGQGSELDFSARSSWVEADLVGGCSFVLSGWGFFAVSNPWIAVGAFAVGGAIASATVS